LPNSVVVGARASGEAVVVTGPEEPLARLRADGALIPVVTPPVTGVAPGYLGFTTRDVGYAIVGSMLWRTDDGAETWQRLDIATP
jgi:hypothetical protein